LQGWLHQPPRDRRRAAISGSRIGLRPAGEGAAPRAQPPSGGACVELQAGPGRGEPAPATASRQWWVAVPESARISSSPRRSSPCPDPGPAARPFSRGSRPSAFGLKPLRSWDNPPAQRGIVTTDSRPEPGRQAGQGCALPLAPAQAEPDPGRLSPRQSQPTATWGSWGPDLSRATRRSSAVEQGPSQWAWPASTWGSQRPRGDQAEALPALRCVHQRNSSRQVGLRSRESGRRSSQRAAAAGSKPTAPHLQGHHIHIFGDRFAGLQRQATPSRPSRTSPALALLWRRPRQASGRRGLAGNDSRPTGSHSSSQAPRVVLVEAERSGRGAPPPNRLAGGPPARVSAQSIRPRPPLPLAIGWEGQGRARKGSIAGRGQVRIRAIIPDASPAPPGDQFS